MPFSFTPYAPYAYAIITSTFRVICDMPRCAVRRCDMQDAFYARRHAA